jgi:hypothetical protein
MCCPNCFVYAWLKDLVQQKSAETGRCWYCESEGVSILSVEELEPYFQNFMDMFERYAGEPSRTASPYNRQGSIRVGNRRRDLDDEKQHSLLEDILVTGGSPSSSSHEQFDLAAPE